jgi:hypothetical protein
MGNVGRPTTERRTVARTDRATKKCAFKSEKPTDV